MKALNLILPIVCPVLKVRDCVRYLTKSIDSSGRKEIQLNKKFKKSLRKRQF